MIGLGLLEQIPESTLAEFAQLQQHQNQGVSGKLNRVWDVWLQQTVVGRSQTSLANLKASIESLQALYLANGAGLDTLLRDQGYQATAQRI